MGTDRDPFRRSPEAPLDVLSKVPYVIRNVVSSISICQVFLHRFEAQTGQVLWPTLNESHFASVPIFYLFYTWKQINNNFWNWHGVRSAWLAGICFPVPDSFWTRYCNHLGFLGFFLSAYWRVGLHTYVLSPDSAWWLPLQSQLLCQIFGEREREKENILVSLDSRMWHLQVRHVWQHSEQDTCELWSQGSMRTLIPGLNPHGDARPDDWPAFAQSHSQLPKWVLTVASEKPGFVPSASSACRLSSACPDVTVCSWEDVKIWYLISVPGDPCVSCTPDAAGGTSVCGLLWWRLLQICDHDGAIGLPAVHILCWMSVCHEIPMLVFAGLALAESIKSVPCRTNWTLFFPTSHYYKLQVNGIIHVCIWHFTSKLFYISVCQTL